MHANNEAQALPANEPITPAQRLLGMTLPRGWQVTEKLSKQVEQSGGYFSQGYIVQRIEDGKKGFLKALDYALILRDDDPAKVMAFQTRAVLFEREILRVCRDNRMDRVIEVIDEGSVRPEGGGPSDVVQYLIFELADGDARRQADVSKRYDAAWALRALHHVATGLNQLHGQRIAHQDLNPSNVLTFGNELSKVGDLGRAASFGVAAPHDDEPIAGNLTYAPPEHLYRAVSPEWNARRYGCDAYLLGSLILSFFLGGAMTPLVQERLAPDYRVGNWRDDYASVLPYVRQATNSVLQVLARELPAALPEKLRSRIVTVTRELCDPDPRLRGHPRNRRWEGNQYILQQYVSAFDLMARQATIALRPIQSRVGSSQS